MIKNIKLAIFDFDDTLAIHINKDYVEHRKKIGENVYFKKAFENPDNFYDEIEPCKVSQDMLNLVSYLRLHGVKMYCLSGMRMSLHADAKQSFINKHYGSDIKLVSASTQEYKVDVVQILQETYNCKPDEVLFVDDLQKVINTMKQHGYVAFLESEIKNIKIDSQTLLEIMND